MKHFWPVILLVLATCTLNPRISDDVVFQAIFPQINDNVIFQNTHRDWKAVADSMIHDKGIMMPELPSDFPTSAGFLSAGRCSYDFRNLLADTVSYEDFCVINETEVYFRIRSIDARQGHEKKVLITTAIVVIEEDHTWCETRLNMGVWEGELNDEFEHLAGDCKLDNQRITFTDRQLNNRFREFARMLTLYFMNL